jgi:hypothetical protein
MDAARRLHTGSVQNLKMHQAPFSMSQFLENPTIANLRREWSKRVSALTMRGRALIRN